MLATYAINEHMARPLRKALLALCLLLILGIVGAYAFKTQLATALLRQIAAQSGATIHGLRDVQLTLNQLQLQEAQLSWQLPHDSKLDLKFLGLKVNFNLENIRAPQLGRLVFSELLIEVNSNAASANSNTAAPDLYALLDSLWLPTELLSIKKLNIKFHSPSFTSLLQTDFEYNEKVLQFRSGEFEFSAAAKPLDLAPKDSSGASTKPAITTPPFSARLTTPLLIKRDGSKQSFIAEPLLLEFSPLIFAPSLSLGAASIKLDNITLNPASLDARFKLETSLLTQALSTEPSPLTLDGKLSLAARNILPNIEASLLMNELKGLVPIKQLLGTFSYTAQNAELKTTKLEAQILGARCSIRPFSYVVGSTTNKLYLDLQGMNLEQLLALYPDAKVSGKALLDGNLPLEIGAGTLSISSGILEARPPGGTLKGDLSAWAAAHPGNEGLQIAAKALSNLHFNHLKTLVTYNSNGNLELQLEIRGQNPDWGANQPLNLNISVAEHVPTLLKTLELFKTPPQRTSH